MTGNTQHVVEPHGNRWRMAIWVAAALLLLLPLLAMQVTGEVNWDGADFAVFGAMLVAACGVYELATRMTAHGAYRAAAGVAIGTAFMLVWANLAVGVIGNEDNPANLMYAGVLAVGIAGAAVARWQSPGMVRALVATAIVQALVALTACAVSPSSGLKEIVVLNGFFVALWLLSAWLFRRAVADQVPAAAAP